MPRPSCTRLKPEALNARAVPSTVFDAPLFFKGRDVAVTRFIATEPCRCLTVSPAFALSFGAASDAAVPALAGRDDGGGDTTL